MPLTLSDAAKQAALSALDLLVAGVAAAVKPSSLGSTDTAPPVAPAAAPSVGLEKPEVAGAWVGPSGRLATVRLQPLPFGAEELNRVVAALDGAIAKANTEGAAESAGAVLLTALKGLLPMFL